MGKENQSLTCSLLSLSRCYTWWRQQFETWLIDLSQAMETTYWNYFLRCCWPLRCTLGISSSESRWRAVQTLRYRDLSFWSLLCSDTSLKRPWSHLGHNLQLPVFLLCLRKRKTGKLPSDCGTKKQTKKSFKQGNPSLSLKTNLTQKSNTI